MQTISQSKKHLLIYKNHCTNLTLTSSTFFIQSKLNDIEDIELAVVISELKTGYIINIIDLPELEETTRLIVKNENDTIYSELIKYVS